MDLGSKWTLTLLVKLKHTLQVENLWVGTFLTGKLVRRNIAKRTEKFGLRQRAHLERTMQCARKEGKIKIVLRFPIEPRHK